MHLWVTTVKESAVFKTIVSSKKRKFLRPPLLLQGHRQGLNVADLAPVNFKPIHSLKLRDCLEHPAGIRRCQRNTRTQK